MRNKCLDCSPDRKKRCNQSRRASFKHNLPPIDQKTREKIDRMDIHKAAPPVLTHPQLLNAKRQTGFKVKRDAKGKHKIEKIIFARTKDMFKQWGTGCSQVNAPDRR
jgi:hypothetical protein